MGATVLEQGGDGIVKGAPLPKYKCHQEVHALKISKVVEHVNNTARLYFEGYFLPREVSMDWKIRHKPKPGGYWVQYKDGYESFSPAEVFEEGYAPMVKFGEGKPYEKMLVLTKGDEEVCLSEEDEKKLQNWFTYHSPDPEDLPRYATLRAAAFMFARYVVKNTPPCADQSAAIRKIREAVMTANAAIACKGK